MRITEVISPEYPEYLYHGTSQGRVAKILKQGITSPSWWGSERIADYYAQEQSGEDGSEPIIITVPLTAFNQQGLEPDGNSIAEPLTHTLGRTEEELYQAWQQCQGTWLDCFDIYESVIYRGGIRVSRDQITMTAQPKRKPNKSEIAIYRSYLRLAAWGKLTPDNAKRKQNFEQIFDVAGITL